MNRLQVGRLLILFVLVVIISNSRQTGFAYQETSDKSSQTSGFCDNFNGRNLKPRWVWVDPLGDSSYSLTSNPGSLQLYTPDGGHDLYLNLDAPRMIQPISGDFVVTTKVTINPQFIYQGAGLLVWGDENNYFRLEVTRGQYDPTPGATVKYRQDGVYVDHSLLVISTTRDIYLKLVRTGNEFSGWMIENKLDWTFVESATIIMDIDLEVGVVIINQWQDNPFSVVFDYFELDSCWKQE